MKKLIALFAGIALSTSVWANTTEKAVLTHYADLAHAMYQDSLITAQALLKAVKQLAAQPTEANLNHAKTAWKAARVPYQQTEAYRFGMLAV